MGKGKGTVKMFPFFTKQRTEGANQDFFFRATISLFFRVTDLVPTFALTKKQHMEH